VRRVLVFQLQRHRAVGTVLNVHAHFRFGAHCEAAAKLAMDSEIIGKLTETRLDDGHADEQNVVSECEPRQPRTPPGQRERNERQRQQKVEEFGENEAQRAGF